MTISAADVGLALAGVAYLTKHSGTDALVVTPADGCDRPLAIVTATDTGGAVADGRDPERTMCAAVLRRRERSRS